MGTPRTLPLDHKDRFPMPDPMKAYRGHKIMVLGISSLI
jgi:hypothetical protein